MRHLKARWKHNLKYSGYSELYTFMAFLGVLRKDTDCITRKY